MPRKKARSIVRLSGPALPKNHISLGDRSFSAAPPCSAWLAEPNFAPPDSVSLPSKPQPDPAGLRLQPEHAGR
jgi:hypothetical protein